MKIFGLVFFIAFFIFAGCNKKDTFNEISEPSELHETNAKIPEYKNIFNDFLLNNNYITIDDPEYKIEKLYLDGNISPIGWSRNGHLAYAQVLDKYGYYDDYLVSQVVIFNIIDDEIINTVNNLKYYSEPSGGGWSEADEIPFGEFWVKYREEIIASLKKYNIIPIKDLKLEDIQTLKERYDLEILLEDSLPTEHDRGWGPFYIRQGKNIVIKNGKDERKTVTEAGEIDIGRTDGTRTEEHSEIDFIGYYKYPYGDRVVLYFYEKRFYQGFEGEERCVSEKRLTGCHLTIGFE
jgi:hypothetical protein